MTDIYTDGSRRLNPNAAGIIHDGVIDADWLASKVMENLDQEAPEFWANHPLTDRGNLRNIIVRVFMDEGAKR
ncbi:hypothetical protein M0765_026690 [Variovorax sp. S2]|uniref:hypothetical protein n=1 Tax=Variovorax sp. S12S4 TaxID=3029170 RepID=UPI00215D2139|nr:hypothetical protein [Variovorax sp. S12S4]MCR8961187.1 hypothetical protein [Variovorax sp. S12S4]